MSKPIMTALLKARHACLTAGLQPKEWLVRVDLKHRLRREIETPFYEHLLENGSRILGAELRFVETGVAVSYRDSAGDTKIALEVA